MGEERPGGGRRRAFLGNAAGARGLGRAFLAVARGIYLMI